MSTALINESTTSDTLKRSSHVAAADLAETHPAVQRMTQYSERTGLPFMCVDCDSWEVLAKTDGVELEIIPSAIRELVTEKLDGPITKLSSGLVYYALPLPDVADKSTLAIGFVLGRSDTCPQQAVLKAAAQGWSQKRFRAWLSDQKYCEPEILERLLASTLEKEDSLHREEQLQQEIDKLASEIEHTFEEISLLHALTGNLQISRSPVDLAELCLDRLQELIPAEGNAIWIQERNGGTHFLVEGNIPFGETELTQLVSRFQDHNWSRPLVKNHQEGTSLGSDFPGLKNFVIVALAEGSHRFGWIVNYNIEDGREFGTVEASLLNSIATILGTHLRNIDLYQQHDELLVSFVRSMVSSLDAKDAYTRGHSERVALVARGLAEELNLSSNDVQDIYFSGLLHDIGKIGVSDAILQKPGALTKEEFEHVKRHPMIGYNILSPLGNLQHVLPGVRNHHEAFDGRGYPDGLVGEETSLMARIMAVADSYDAMRSDRPYRDGMSLQKTESIFREEAGKQWDPKVIDAYFRARDNILQMWSEYDPADDNLRPPAPRL